MSEAKKTGESYQSPVLEPCAAHRGITGRSVAGWGNIACFHCSDGNQ
jgi:hypothetical protein